MAHHYREDAAGALHPDDCAHVFFVEATWCSEAPLSSCKGDPPPKKKKKKKKASE